MSTEKSPSQTCKRNFFLIKVYNNHVPNLKICFYVNNIELDQIPNAVKPNMYVYISLPYRSTKMIYCIFDS